MKVVKHIACLALGVATFNYSIFKMFGEDNIFTFSAYMVSLGVCAYYGKWMAKTL